MKDKAWDIAQRHFLGHAPSRSAIGKTKKIDIKSVDAKVKTAADKGRAWRWVIDAPTSIVTAATYLIATITPALAVYATYFDGFLTNGAKARWVHSTCSAP